MTIVFTYRFESKKKAYAEIERICNSSALICPLSTMTIMTDKSPRQITVVAYKRRYPIRGAKGLETLTSPCATSTFQSRETANRAFYALYLEIQIGELLIFLL